MNRSSFSATLCFPRKLHSQLFRYSCNYLEGAFFGSAGYGLTVACLVISLHAISPKRYQSLALLVANPLNYRVPLIQYYQWSNEGMFRLLLIFLLKDSRRKNSHRSQLIQSLFHSSAVYNSHTLGEISHGSAKIIHKGFAYLMNNGIQGNYAEFGVYEGSTTLEAYRASKLYGMKNMSFYIFDSFEGLPELSDGDGIGPFHAGQFKSGATSFMKILKREKVEIEKFRIFEGYFENVLPQLKLPPDNFS